MKYDWYDWVEELIIGSIFWIYVLMTPVAAGYFYNRPFCQPLDSTPSPVAARVICGSVTAIFWPITLPGNISARIFGD